MGPKGVPRQCLVPHGSHEYLFSAYVVALVVTAASSQKTSGS